MGAVVRAPACDSGQAFVLPREEPYLQEAG